MATRRQMLQASGALLVSLLTAATAFAQEPYPGSREVHVIVTWAPGSTPDILTRYFSENMRPFLGGTIVVENKVGASGNIGMIYVAKAKPDGYTVLSAAPSGIAAGPSLFKNPVTMRASLQCSAAFAGLHSRSVSLSIARTTRCRA